MVTVRIPLSSRKYPGLFAIIDEEDYPLVAGKTWHPRPYRHGFHAFRNVWVGGGKTRVERMHRIIIGDKDGEIVDHINRNGLDNRHCNLRIATFSENNQNRASLAGSLSAYLGVKPNGPHWAATTSHNGKEHYLGTFLTQEAAAHAYDTGVRQLHGPHACVNFPDGDAFDYEALRLSPKNNGTGFRGITLVKATGRWMAQITHGGANHYLGYFATPHEAARAYDQAALRLLGSEAILNFPQEATR